MRPWDTSVSLFLTAFKLRIDIMRTTTAMTDKRFEISDELFASLVEAYESTLAKHNYTNLLAMANRDPRTTAASFSRIRERVVGVCKRRLQTVLLNEGIVMDIDECFKLVEASGKVRMNQLDAVN
jgi:hypothetical protein